ncbi:MAG: peptidylprolyl isomerase [Melioribacteraceae bacterium]|nr:peptidylprolyl isomerase [Melioribacteraceae bacterium]
MYSRIIITTLLILVLGYKSTAQTLLLDEVIAKVGSKTISSDEFLERIELTPQFRKNIKRLMPSVKLEFLYTLITEKLWALEAEKMGLDTSESIRTAVSLLEKMFSRDALFNKEVREKIVIPEEDYILATIRNNKYYLSRYLFSEDSTEIFSLHNHLLSGSNFDSLLAGRQELSEQPDTLVIVFGDLIESIEDSLYKLSENEFTSPVSAPDGWYIFYAYKIEERNLNTPEQLDEAESYVEKILTERIGENLQNSFYRDFFNDKKVDADRQLFIILAESLCEIFKKKDLLRREGSTTLLTFDAWDLLGLKSGFNDKQLNSDFIRFDNDPVSLNDFMNYLTFEGFQIDKYSKNKVYGKLNTQVKLFIERELLAREAIKRGLNQTQEVQKYVNMWRDYYLSQAFLSSRLDTVHIDSTLIKSLYNERYKEAKYPELLNIIEILVDSLSIAEKIYKDAAAGSDFSQLAEQYSKRTWTRETKGEYGFFPTTQFGKLGEIASKLELNEISRPIKLKEGYSVIKLIGRKHEQIEEPFKKFDEVKNKLKLEAAFDSQYSDLVDLTAESARENLIKINPYSLDKLKISNINTFAIRVLGFGGKITAVPIARPFSGWVQKWLSRYDILP